MKIISIANRKGGVGKTVISGNIAYELSKMGYLVLMVDLDSQCDLSKIYLQDGYEGSSIFHLLRQQCRLDDACVEVGENLYLIPGSRDIVHFDFRGSESILLHYLKQECLEKILSSSTIHLLSANRPWQALSPVTRWSLSVMRKNLALLTLGNCLTT